MISPMIPQPPTIARIPPIHRMAGPFAERDVGAMRRMGYPRPATARDVESAEVLDNIKALL